MINSISLPKINNTRLKKLYIIINKPLSLILIIKKATIKFIMII